MQLRICLLLDSLYAGAPGHNLCKDYHWKYITTFKEGSMPEVYKEYLSLIECQKMYQDENKKIIEFEDKVKQITWVSDITFAAPCFNVLSCKETKQNKGKKETKNFVWLTNFNIDETNCDTIARGGRLRWKIENEGFNIQKNGGYNLQHPYSENERAMKNYYLCLQIGHLFNQLMEQGSLFADDVKKLFGSIENFTFMLLESLITSIFDLSEIENIDSSRFQITIRGP